VTDVSLSAEEECWMRPLVEVDEIKLPLDLWKFMTGQIHIHEINAHEVALSLRESLAGCHHGSHAEAPTEIITSAPARSVASGAAW
jgi:hypothetical protein